MEPGAIIVMILALLALIGVVVFFVYDYLKHKDSNAKDFTDTSTRIDTEKKDRLSNLKFVVDQVNDVNNDIYDTMMSNVGRLETSHSNLSGIQSGMLAGLGSFLQFSSNSIDGSSHTLNLLDLPGTINPNVELMQHVTAMMGLTVKDLDGATGNTVKFCSKADPTRCVQIPDDKGDVILKGLVNTGKVVVDSPLSVSGSVQLTKEGIPSDSPVTLSTDGTSMFMQGQKLAIGTGFTDPSAKLHIKTDTGVDALKVSLPAADAILVSADGSLVTTQPIMMKRNLADQNAVATLSIDTDSTNNTDFLKVQTNRLHVQGDFSVSGSAKVAGQDVALVPNTPAL
jgi:hypothetical protein